MNSFSNDKEANNRFSEGIAEAKDNFYTSFQENKKLPKTSSQYKETTIAPPLTTVYDKNPNSINLMNSSKKNVSKENFTVEYESLNLPSQATENWSSTERNVGESLNSSNKNVEKKYFSLPSPISDTESKIYSNTEHLFQKHIANYLTETFMLKTNLPSKNSHSSSVLQTSENVPSSYKENFESGEEEKTWFENRLWNANPKLYHLYIKYNERLREQPTKFKTNKLESWDDVKNQISDVKNIMYFYYSLTLFIISETIMIIPNLLKDFVVSSSYLITRSLTNEENISDDQIKEDSNVLVNIIYCIFTFPIVVYVTYNWYFLTAYYKKKDNNELRPARDENRYKIRFYDGYGMVFKPILVFLFDAALKPLEKLDAFFFGDNSPFFPYLLKMIKYDSETTLNNVKRLILLLIGVYFVYYLNFFTTFDILLKGETQSIVYLCSFIIVLFQISTFYNYVMAPMFDKEISPTELASNYAKYTLRVINPLVFIFACLLYIGILLAQAILIAHPSAMICLVYFWVHSMFGISIYGEGLPFTDKWFLHIKSMEDDFDKDVITFYKDDGCINPGILKIIVRNIVKIIRCNLNLLVLMVILVMLFMKSILTLNSKSFMFSICMFLGIFILSLIPKFIYDIYRDFQNKGYQIGDSVCKNESFNKETYGDDKPEKY